MTPAKHQGAQERAEKEATGFCFKGVSKEEDFWAMGLR